MGGTFRFQLAELASLPADKVCGRAKRESEHPKCKIIYDDDDDDSKCILYYFKMLLRVLLKDQILCLCLKSPKFSDVDK